MDSGISDVMKDWLQVTQASYRFGDRPRVVKLEIDLWLAPKDVPCMLAHASPKLFSSHLDYVVWVLISLGLDNSKLIYMYLTAN